MSPESRILTSDRLRIALVIPSKKFERSGYLRRKAALNSGQTKRGCLKSQPQKG